MDVLNLLLSASVKLLLKMAAGRVGVPAPRLVVEALKHEPARALHHSMVVHSALVPVSETVILKIVQQNQVNGLSGALAALVADRAHKLVLASMTIMTIMTTMIMTTMITTMIMTMTIGAQQKKVVREIVNDPAKSYHAQLMLNGVSGLFVPRLVMGPKHEHVEVPNMAGIPPAHATPMVFVVNGLVIRIVSTAVGDPMVLASMIQV
jgi:hypothetical protein